MHNEYTNEYKKKYKIYIRKILEAIDNQTIRQSNGALLGLMRGLSDYDELCSDKKLMKITYEADKYYSCKCKT